VGEATIFETLNYFPILLAETSFMSGFLTKAWGIFQGFLGLGFVVFVHELGHFLAAKTFGVRCDKFYVGFDPPLSIGPIKLPRTLGKFQWGETEYGIGIIPLGGYVKMLGQDDDPRNSEEAEQTRLDPRSYLAKKVWQRMIIISAGVVMNLIFAVILAAIAYRVGVPYMPTVVGDTTNGGPAWQAGVQPGDVILRAGKMTQENPNLRFEEFMVAVALYGKDSNGAPIPVLLERDGQRIELSLKQITDPETGRHLIGVQPSRSTKLSSIAAFLPDSYLASKNIDLQPRDEITGVDGQPLKVDPKFGEPLGSELLSRIQAKWNQPVKLTVVRPSRDEKGSASNVEVELPPVPQKSIGLDFQIGPVTVVREKSAGEKAGIKVGDVIVAIDGQPVNQALRLPSIVATKAGKTFEMKVKRDVEGATTEVALQVEAPESPRFAKLSFSSNSALTDLGVAYEVTDIVSTVDAAMIESGTIQPGDQLAQIRWEPNDEQVKALEKIAGKRAVKEWTNDQLVGAKNAVPSIMDRLDFAPDGMNVRCYVRRDGKTLDYKAKVHYAADWYDSDRGLALAALNEMHKVDSMAEAFPLGAKETWSKFTEVLTVLRMLFTGKLSVNGLSGPIGIFEAAGAEANRSVSALLLFLTFLSANLAIINFLPIPALDGGHMMFLTAEAIRGKPVNEALQVRLTVAGVLCLLGLMIFVIGKDIFERLPL
jgi:regulator of sigma E protease